MFLRGHDDAATAVERPYWHEHGFRTKMRMLLRSWLGHVLLRHIVSCRVPSLAVQATATTRTSAPSSVRPATTSRSMAVSTRSTLALQVHTLAAALTLCQCASYAATAASATHRHLAEALECNSSLLRV